MITVFLGGTCNGSKWREKVMPLLTVDYFNPVVEDWNEEAQKNEEFHRENDDFVLYVLTPKMVGTYAVAEVVDDSNKRPKKTILCTLRKDDDTEFDNVQWKSISKVTSLVAKNGATVLGGLDEVVDFLNRQKEVK